MEDDDDIRCAILTGDESGRRVFRRREPEGSEDAHDGVARGLHQEHRQAQAPRVRGARQLPEADRGRDQRLRGGHRLHRHVLLRPPRRVREGGVAVAAGGARHPARVRRRDAAGALGGTRPGDAARARLPAPRGGGAPHRPRAVGGAARRADGQVDEGGEAPRVAAAAGRAAHQGVAAARHSTSRTSRTPRSSTSTASRCSSSPRTRRKATRRGGRSARRSSRDADVDLALTEPQEMLRSSARTFVDREAPTHAIVALQKAESSLVPDLWRKASEAGLARHSHSGRVRREREQRHRRRRALRAARTRPAAGAVLQLGRARRAHRDGSGDGGAAPHDPARCRQRRDRAGRRAGRAERLVGRAGHHAARPARR